MNGKLLLCRKSQQKFKFDQNELLIYEEHRKLEILGFNKAFDAKLHTAAVLFLLALGLNESILIELAKEEINQLQEDLKDIENVIKTNEKTKPILSKLLSAGFPLENEFVFNECDKIQKKRTESLKKEGKIKIQKGATLLMIPDHTGELEEGQIFIQFSDRSKYNCTILESKACLFRPPIQLLSDFQILTAVDVPILHNYYDCVIFSTKGNISPASMLSGGDYDGDLAWIIWDERFFDLKCFDKKLPIPKKLNEFSKIHPIGSEPICSYIETNSLQENLREYFFDQANSYLGILTNYLSYLLMMQINNSSSRKQISLNNEILLIGYLCANAVDAAKAGTKIILPKCQTSDYKLSNSLYLKLKELQIPNDITPIEYDLDLINNIYSTNIDEIHRVSIASKANSFLGELKQKKNGYLNIINYGRCRVNELYPLSKLRNRNNYIIRLTFASICYSVFVSLKNTMASEKQYDLFKRILYEIFIDEFCRIKADAVSMKKNNQISFSIVE